MKKKKKKGNYFWGITICILIIFAYVLPYTVLSTVQKWYGSFFVWGLIGLCIIFANVMVTRNWRE